MDLPHHSCRGRGGPRHMEMGERRECTAAKQMRGVELPLTSSAAGSSAQPARRPTIFMGLFAKARTSLPTACLRWMRRRASANGTTRLFTTISGTTTILRRQSWSRLTTVLSLFPATPSSSSRKWGSRSSWIETPGNRCFRFMRFLFLDSTMAGEEAWPTQPFPLKPRPLVRAVAHRGRSDEHYAGGARIRRQGVQEVHSSGSIYTPPSLQV